MSTILNRIAEYKRAEVAAARSTRPMAAVAAAARSQTPPRGFRAALARAAMTGYGLIGEIKRASPSKGLIRADFDAATLARAYAIGGAHCLSVLTDAPSFQGAPADLIAARASCELPCLRKDFLLDPYQVVEARAWGADCILVILAMVDDELAAALIAAAADWGMDVLVEVHDDAELTRALALPGSMVGINNRNLHSFETRLEVTETLAPRVPAGRMVVAESGLATPADLARMARCGVRSFLIGESLMRQPDVTAATRALLGTPA